MNGDSSFAQLPHVRFDGVDRRRFGASSIEDAVQLVHGNPVPMMAQNMQDARLDRDAAHSNDPADCLARKFLGDMLSSGRLAWRPSGNRHLDCRSVAISIRNYALDKPVTMD